MGDEDSTRTMLDGIPLRLGPRGTALLSGIERFTILKKLGEGGMGTVYAAYDSVLDRRVALKVVRADRRRSDAPVSPREQLLREAQAMARLSHPNVVAIHEVGEIGDDVFVVLELVDGATLQAWLSEAPRDWRAVVGAYIEAGRGLVAAHAAGLVHRDFKPQNVLVRRDGRIQVADFGVVSMGGSPSDSSSDSGQPSASSQLTFAGRRVGTLAYMAPEQYAGAPVDGRADQFSFAVSLWESLYGTRAFAGKGAQLAEAMAAGAIVKPPADTTVPRWIEPVLRRALSPKPEDRYATIGELMTALGYDVERVRRRRVIVGVASVVIAALGVVAWLGWTRRSSAPPPCSGAEQLLEGHWDAARAAAVRRALATSQLPFAPAAALRIIPQLDAWSRAWVAMRVDACRATRVRGDQSEQLLDARIRCLDRELDEVDVLAGALVKADRDALAHAARSLELPVVEACADREQVMMRVPPPSDRALRVRVETLEHQLAVVRGSERMGHYHEARGQAAELATAAAAAGFRPLVGETLLVRGQLEEQDGDLAAATQSLAAAAHTAGEARDDATGARALLSLIDVYIAKGESGPALAIGVAADAAVARAKEPGLDALLAEQLGAAHTAAGDDAAQTYLERALSLRRAATPDGVEVADLLNKLGGVALRRGDAAGARARYEEALRIVVAQLGPDHPSSAITRANLCYLDAQAGKLAEARACQEQVLAVLERALGPDHPQVAWALNEVALVQRDQGDLEGAVQRFERALAIWEHGPGTDVEWPLVNLGEIALERGDHVRALALCTRAVDVVEKASGPSHPDLVAALTCRAMALQPTSPRDAIAVAQRARTIARAHGVAEDPELTKLLAKIR